MCEGEQPAFLVGWDAVDSLRTYSGRNQQLQEVDYRYNYEGRNLHQMFGRILAERVQIGVHRMSFELSELWR